jgi:DNA uptake protein ComE-like DNA-binding protein
MSRPLSVLWALVPLLTFGWGAGFSFGYAALRLRDGVLGAWAWVYFVFGVTSFILVVSSKSDNDWEGTVGALLAIILIAIGTGHAFVVRRRLSESASVPQYRVGSVSQQELALAEARTELERRREARQILRNDSEMAWQLRIGRPDLSRRYQDGGLVDANHASANALAALPGISPRLASEIVTTRDSVGGFQDLNDMSVTLGISPQALDVAATFLVFPRYGAPG